jgi:cytochrome P450
LTDSSSEASQVLAGLLSGEGLADPYPFYAELHRLGPVSALPDHPSYAALVNGYDAVGRVLRDPVFRVSDAAFAEPLMPDWHQHPVLAMLYGSMMFSNAPHHTRMRRLFQAVFTPRRVVELEPAIVRLTDDRLDRIAALGANGAEVDFMAEFAYLLPSGVVAALLGIPDDDLGWFRPRVERINDYLDVAGKTPEVLAAADTATLELTGYYTDLIARRGAQPRDDLVSSLVQAVDAEPTLTDEELVSNLLVLFNASFVTTIHLLGNGLRILLDRPELAAALRSEPAAAASYVEEMLRFDTSVQFVARFATQDTEVAGVTMPAGRLVLIVLGAANRDPKRYRDPDVFDPARQDSKPLSFGAGPHYCLGAALARAEARLAFPMLLRRFPALAAGGPPVRNQQQFLRGYSRLPVVI